MVISDNLPIRIGFILSDGRILEKGRSHRHAAAEYLKKTGQEKDYLNSDFSAEDDYLVLKLGAIRLYCTGGTNYCYCTNYTYREKYRIIKAYKEAGYKLIVANFEEAYEEPPLIASDEKREYNRQFIWNSSLGKYTYNPIRIGE